MLSKLFSKIKNVWSRVSNSIKILLIIILTLSATFYSYNVINDQYTGAGDVLITIGKRQILTGDAGKIDWDVTSSGYSYDGKYHLFGSFTATSPTDIAIISPEKFKAGSKVYIEKPVTIEYKKNYQRTCIGDTYGWEVVDEIVYCNTTILVSVNNSVQYDIKTLIYVTSENYFDNPTNTIYWNDTYTRTKTIRKDFTSKILRKTVNTPFGDEIYYIKNINQSFDFEIILDVDDKYLPLKYTVCFGDIATNTLDLCLDPEVIDSREFTITVDFENGTSTNVTTGNNEIALANTIDLSDSSVLVAHWRLDEPTGTLFDVNGNFDFTTITGIEQPGDISFINNTIQCNGIDDGAGIGENNMAESATTFNAGENWTMGFWGYPTVSSHGTNYHPAFGQFGTGSELSFMFGSFQSNNYYILYYHTGGSSRAIGGTSSGVDIQNQWTYVVATKNNTALTIWINGQYNNSLPISSGEIIDQYPGLTVRMCDAERATSSYPAFPGYVDEMWLMNRTLSATEIRNSYDEGRGKTHPYLFNLGTFTEDDYFPSSGQVHQNVSISFTNTSDPGGGNVTGEAWFRYNSSVASRDTSRWTKLTTTTLDINTSSLGTSSIYIEFKYNETSNGRYTPSTTAYILNMGDDSIPTIFDERTNKTVLEIQGQIIKILANITSADGNDIDTILFYIAFPNGTIRNYTGYR